MVYTTHYRAEVEALCDRVAVRDAGRGGAGARLGGANPLLALAPFGENAEELFGIALSLYEEIGDRYSVARGLFYFGQWLGQQGQAEEAQAAFAQSRDLFLALGMPQVAAVVEGEMQRIGSK